jgi:hypothetical protein
VRSCASTSCTRRAGCTLLLMIRGCPRTCKRRCSSGGCPRTSSRTMAAGRTRSMSARRGG